jgi:uncharacterized lipoprotein YbaY
MAHVLAVAAIFSATAQGQERQRPDTVTLDVTMSYRERLGLPRGTRYGAQLAATPSGEDGVLAEASDTTDGRQPPLRLRLTFPRSRVRRDRDYFLHATIAFRGQLWFEGVTRLTVPLPSSVHVTLVRRP